MTSIKITNVTSEGRALPLVRCLEGRSYMDLRVVLAPAGGSFDVWAGTSRPDTTEDELREMILELLAQRVMAG